MKKKYLIAFLFLGALAVLLGAFGAHGLKGKIPDSSLVNYKTAVYYQFIHVLAGIAVILIAKNHENIWFRISIRCFLIGTLCFSGSLFFLTTNSISNIGLSFIWGPMTPIGGLILITAWITAAIGVAKTTSDN